MYKSQNPNKLQIPMTEQVVSLLDLGFVWDLVLGFGNSHVRTARHDLRQHEGTLVTAFFARAQKHTQADTPANLKQLTSVTERTAGKLRFESPQRTQVTAGNVDRQASFEVMDRHVLVPFAFRVPQDRRFHGTDQIGVDRVDLIITVHQITGPVDGRTLL
jgi:hypothetical protein